jgi:hypothetical protein
MRRRRSLRLDDGYPSQTLVASILAGLPPLLPFVLAARRQDDLVMVLNSLDEKARG